VRAGIAGAGSAILGTAGALYANQVAREARVEVCRDNHWGVYRRCSGGGCVVQGPGCLNYSLILPVEKGGPLRSVAAANRFIMEKHRDALQTLLDQRGQPPGRAPAAGILASPRVTVEGHTDLAMNGWKCSGNAQRRARNWLLFHGTFLLSMDLAPIERALPMPTREPSYRNHRSHREFLVNLGLPATWLRNALCGSWEANEPLAEWPLRETASLARDKYATNEWNFKF